MHLINIYFFLIHYLIIKTNFINILILLNTKYYYKNYKFIFEND